MAESLAMMISQCNVDFLKVNRAYVTGLQCSYYGKLFGDLIVTKGFTILHYTLHFEMIALMID